MLNARQSDLACIFDLDGTIIDSEEHYYQADRIMLAEYGIEFTNEMKETFIGTGNYEMMKRIKVEYGLSESAEELLQKKNALYLRIALGHTAAYPEMLALLELLHAHSYPMAIGSGTSLEVIEAFLADLKIRHFFRAVVSAEDVARGKPAPDVFLEAACRLNAPPGRCIVFEDAQYGVMAAQNAGMRCVAIPYLTRKPLPECFMRADLLFPEGMPTFSARAVMAWLATIQACDTQSMR
jgi:beta-phosphoglucomutase family hydrolase